MERREFNEKMLELAKIYMPDWILSQGKLKLRKQEKINDTVLWGITIEDETAGEKAVPVLYLEEFYEEYISGKSLIEVAKQLVEIYERAWEEIPDVRLYDLKMGDFKSLILFKIVNASKNEEMLKNIEYRMINDEFAMVCYAQVAENACMTITRAVMDEFGITADEMCDAAWENTPRLCPAVFEKMDEVASGKMCVLTNQYRYCGASAIFYPGVLEKISAELEGDFYAIPSSIHEWIIFRSDDQEEIMHMENTIAIVNETLCHKTEVLGEQLYMYDSSKKEFKLWKTP